MQIACKPLALNFYNEISAYHKTRSGSVTLIVNLCGMSVTLFLPFVASHLEIQVPPAILLYILLWYGRLFQG